LTTVGTDFSLERKKILGCGNFGRRCNEQGRNASGLGILRELATLLALVRSAGQLVVYISDLQKEFSKRGKRKGTNQSMKNISI
jgi:hypothetical protein